MIRTEIDLNELVERVRKLERQNRRWKLATVLLLFVGASSLATSLLAQQRIMPPEGVTPLMRAKTVEAQSFLLKDADGNIRGQMNLKADRPTFELYDKNGRVVWSAPTRAELIPAR
jgi:hypothetical protein